MIKIPKEVLVNILMVYNYKDREDLKKLGNLPDLICDGDQTVYTTWSDVFDIKDRIEDIRKRIRG